jgi:hypothetical protein
MSHRLIAAIRIALIPLLTVACGETPNPVAPAPAGAPATSGHGSASSGRSAMTGVEVCHSTGGRNGFTLLSIAASAVEAHLNHGDALPGQPVPGQPGMAFDAHCRPIASREVTTVSGSWNGTTYLFNQLFTTGSVGVVDAEARVSGFSGDMRLALLGYDPSTNTCSFFFPGPPLPVGDAMAAPLLTAHWENVPAGTYCLNVVPAAGTLPSPPPYHWTATITHPQ